MPNATHPLAEPTVPAWFNLEALPEELRARRAEVIDAAERAARIIMAARKAIEPIHQVFLEVDRAVDDAIDDDSDEAGAALGAAARLLGLDVLYTVLAFGGEALDVMNAGAFDTATPAGQRARNEAEALCLRLGDPERATTLAMMLLSSAGE